MKMEVKKRESRMGWAEMLERSPAPVPAASPVVLSDRLGGGSERKGKGVKK